jgi:5' nucleotidase, deoxy (Pyrimidine), cytosolic type C protein (NT5C)
MRRCFIDMDGVLVDFHAGAARHHGVPYPEPWPAGVWHVDRVLGVGHTAFWSTLDEYFWSELEPTADGLAILDLAERLFGPDRVCILSSPPRDPASLAGKCRWIQTHLPRYDRQFLIGPCKHMVAGPDAYLLDDSDDNIAQFQRAGGVGILIPRPWNSGHAIPVDNVLPGLEDRLRRLGGW